MEAAAAGSPPAGPRSLRRALAGARPQERPGCPPASAGGSEAEARVLVINTGGTIGMVEDVNGKGRRGPAAPQGAALGERGLGLPPPWLPALPCDRSPRRGRVAAEGRAPRWGPTGRVSRWLSWQASFREASPAPGESRLGRRAACFLKQASFLPSFAR